MRLVIVVLGVTTALLIPQSAAARPCADNSPFIVKGVSYIVYTGDSEAERRRVPCSKARRMVRRFLVDRVELLHWNCKIRRRDDRGTAGDCHAGKRLTNEFGYRYWEYFVGWYPYVPH